MSKSFDPSLRPWNPAPAEVTQGRGAIGSYELLKQIGRGATGTVYLAKAASSEREVAVKVLHSGGGPDAHDRFIREVAIARRLIHRHMVRVIDSGEDDGVPFLVMEMLRGQSLRDLLKQTSAGIDVDTALDLVVQLSVGLHHAHEQGLVHRDIKPANVFLTQEGVVKILDFGVAKLTDSTMTAEGSLVGTLAYMAPEQLTGRGAIDGRADIFSAGVLLYELLTGQRPFDSDSPAAIIARIVQDKPQLPAKLPEPLASLPELDALVRRALDKDPVQRFETAQEFAHALWKIQLAPRASVVPANVGLGETLYAELPEPLEQTLDVEPPRPAPVAKRPVWLYPAIAAGALALVAALAVFFKWTGPSVQPGSAVTAGPADPGGATAKPAAGTSKVVPGPGDVAGPSVPPPVTTTAPVTRAEVFVRSNPEGASVIQGGKAIGTTPVRVELSIGDQLRLERNGFDPATVKVDQTALTKGELPVATLIAQARVRVRATGPYPFEIVAGSRVVSPDSSSHDVSVTGNQPLRMRASDYLLDEPIKYARGATAVEVTAPALGKLTVLATVQTCPVTVRGRDFGPAPFTIPVAPGQYDAVLKCADGRTGRASAEVAAGATGVATIRLVR